MEHVSSTTAEALFDLVQVVFCRFGLELRILGDNSMMEH